METLREVRKSESINKWLNNEIELNVHLKKNIESKILIPYIQVDTNHITLRYLRTILSYLHRYPIADKTI